MKYAKFSDDFLSYFRLDDNGETLVLTDKRGYTRAVRLLPYEERPQGDLISREDLLFAIRQQLAFQKEKAELTTIDADKMAHSLVATGIQIAIDIINNAPTVEPRIEYGTDGQPYRLFMSGGQVVPDTLQGWRYEGETNDQSIL